MNKVSVGWMYPDLLNLHGERASVQILPHIGENIGIEVEIRKINDPEGKPSFEDLDLLVFLPGEISALKNVVLALAGNDEFCSYIENGGYVLAIGTTGAIFGKEIVRLDGSVTEGFGFFDMTSAEREYVWGDDLHIRLNDTKQELVGSQIQMVDVSAKTPLAQVLYGMGNNNTGVDGARYKNLIYTNCLGPVLVKNPWYAEGLLKDICLKKYLKIARAHGYNVANDSFAAALKWISNKPLR